MSKSETASGWHVIATRLSFRTSVACRLLLVAFSETWARLKAKLPWDLGTSRSEKALAPAVFQCLDPLQVVSIASAAPRQSTYPASDVRHRRIPYAKGPRSARHETSARKQTIFDPRCVKFQQWATFPASLRPTSEPLERNKNAERYQHGCVVERAYCAVNMLCCRRDHLPTPAST